MCPPAPTIPSCPRSRCPPIGSRRLIAMRMSWTMKKMIPARDPGRSRRGRSAPGWTRSDRVSPRRQRAPMPGPPELAPPPPGWPAAMTNASQPFASTVTPHKVAVSFITQSPSGDREHSPWASQRRLSIGAVMRRPPVALDLGGGELETVSSRVGAPAKLGPVSGHATSRPPASVGIADGREGVWGPRPGFGNSLSLPALPVVACGPRSLGGEGARSQNLNFRSHYQA